MKACSNCGITKPLTDYHRLRDKRRAMCKMCRKSRGHYRKTRYHDGHFTVYYLPEHHYVGMTNALRNRLQEHRSRKGRFTEGYEIIATFERAVDAHLMETKLHAMGYNGFYYKTFDKKK
jgi:hypothetical protein